MMQPLIDRLGGPQGRCSWRSCASGLRKPELAAEWDRSVVGRKREHMPALVRGAIERGELPADTDVELVAELPSAIIWHHALDGFPVDRDLAQRVVVHILGR